MKDNKLIAVDYIEYGDTWQVEFDGTDNDVIVSGKDANTEEQAIELAIKERK